MMDLSSEFDYRCMQKAFAVAENSHCCKQKVGAVIADPYVCSVYAEAYNRFSTHAQPCREDEAAGQFACPRSSRGGCLYAIHAEQYAIFSIFEQNKQALLAHCTIYTTLSPCLACARLILQAGIKRVIYAGSYAHFKSLPQEDGLIFLNHFGISVFQLEK